MKEPSSDSYMAGAKKAKPLRFNLFRLLLILWLFDGYLQQANVTSMLHNVLIGTVSRSIVAE